MKGGAELGGEFVLRLAIGAASTQMRHIDGIWDLLCSEADMILNPPASTSWLYDSPSQTAAIVAL